MSSASPATWAEPRATTATWLRRLAVALGVVALAELVVLLVLSSRGGDRFPLDADLVSLGFLGSIASYSIVGVLIALQRPFSRVAWLMIATGVGLGTSVTSFGYGTVGTGPTFDWPAAIWFLVFSQFLFLPSIGALATALLLIFPNDRLVSPRWRWALGISLAGSILFIVGSIFRPDPLPTDLPPTVYSPLAAPTALRGLLAGAVDAGNALAITGILVGAISLVVRYRRADRVEGAQIRWLAFVGLVAALGLGLGVLPVSVASSIGFSLGVLALAAMPVAVGIAITRYRLYEIDRLINRAIVYGALTAILAGVFTAAVGLAQRLFVALTNETSDAAIVATTLIVATLYAPLRKRLDALVDRRFKYEQVRFGSYRDELRKTLSLVDAQAAADRLATELARETGIPDVAVLDAAGAPTAVVGGWPMAAPVAIAIPGGHGPLSAVAFGARPGEAQRLERRRPEIEEIAGLAARAVRRAERRSR